MPILKGTHISGPSFTSPGSGGNSCANNVEVTDILTINWSEFLSTNWILGSDAVCGHRW